MSNQIKDAERKITFLERELESAKANLEDLQADAEIQERAEAREIFDDAFIDFVQSAMQLISHFKKAEDFKHVCLPKSASNYRFILEMLLDDIQESKESFFEAFKSEIDV